MIDCDLTAQALLEPWSGPFGGVPPFHIATPSSIEAACRRAIELKHADIRAIATVAEPATFENTIAALEDSGRALRRVTTLYRACCNGRSDDEMQRVEQRLAPLLSALEDASPHDDALFSRVASVRDDRSLTASEQRLTELIYRRMTRRGATLEGADRARLAKIAARIAEQQACFTRNERLANASAEVLIDDGSDLEGLDDATRGTAARAAAARGFAGSWIITADRNAVWPVLMSATRRALRERVWHMWIERAASSNVPVVEELLALRGEQARLLGFASYAHYALDDRMAATPEAALSFAQMLWERLQPAADEQARALKDLAAGDGLVALEPWDRPYYAERLRRRRFGFDDAALRPYLSLDAMLRALFWSAERVYGLTFREQTGIPTLHADVRVFELRRNGRLAGAIWFDPFRRPGKRTSGWMEEYRCAESFRGSVAPLAAVSLGEASAGAGEPVLLSWDSARMLFHETGHALHALLNEADYPAFGALNVAWDAIEIPSQLNERCLEDPAVLGCFARHHVTGETLPAPMLTAFLETQRFDLARPLEALASAIVDLRVHLAADGSRVDAPAIERAVRDELRMPPELDMRHRVWHFTHIFAEDRYAAGYYAYAWADVIVADAAEAFAESGNGMIDRETGERFRATMLAVGNSVAPDEAFRAFRGRDPRIEPLLRRLGVPVA